VALFFLISGFVIPFSLAKLSAPAFLANRLFRIYPVYAAGFAIMLAARWAVGQYFDVPWSIGWTRIALHVPGLRDLAGIDSLDNIIWTLDIEIKFYLVCALGAPLFRRPGPSLLWLPAIIGICGVLLWSIMLAMGQAIVMAEALAINFAYILFMFCGTTFYMLHVGALRPVPAAGIIVTLAAGHAVLLSPEMGQAIYNWNYALGIAVFAIAYWLRGQFGANRVTEFFASISYSLYAVHAVLGWTILRILSDWNVPPLAALAIATGAAILAAWIVHRMVELPSQAAGRAVASRLQRRRDDRAVRAAVAETSSS